MCIRDSKALDTRPVFSPDGKSLAYLAMARPGFEADRQGIMVMSWPAGEPRGIAPKWDRSAESMAWSKDGKTMYVVATNLGHQSLFSICLLYTSPSPRDRQKSRM